MRFQSSHKASTDRQRRIQELKDCTKKLNPYAILSRYPDDRFFVNRSEAEEAIKLAKKVYDFVQAKIKKIDPNMRLF